MNKNILVVEDDPIGRQLMAIYLKDRFEVTFASDLDEALSLVNAQKHFDLILTDLNLGKGVDCSEGLKLLEEIRSISFYDNTPVIAITAHIYSADIEKFIEDGFTEIMVKPIFKDSFLAKLDSFLLSV